MAFKTIPTYYKTWSRGTQPLCASTKRFNFPLQSVEPRVIQLILKDPSLWSMMAYLNSADVLTAPPTTAGSRHCFRCRHSRRQSWIPPSSPSGQQVPEVTVMICSIADTAHGQLRLHHHPSPVPSLQTFLPANHLLHRFQQAPTMSTLMNELLRCESLAHS